jgi:hypothetical protein
MSKSTTPKLVILDLKSSRIIYILSPNAKTTKQARKYRKKKNNNKTHNTAPKKGNGEKQWRSAGEGKVELRWALSYGHQERKKL